MKTVQMIHNCVKESTMLFCRDETTCINTDEIAIKVNISRAVASKYLNQMVKDNVLVKITTRPVIFFDCSTIKKMKNIEINTYEFISIGEFLNYIHSKECTDEFEDVIGYKASLSEAVIKLKSNIKYPTEIGAPVIITGEKGTGKKFLAKCLFNYAKSEKVIEKDKRLYVLNCTRDERDYSRQLFGKNDKGYLEIADGSVLYIKDANNLDIDSQNELASYLENGYIHGVPDKRIKKINVKLIFAMTMSPEDTLCARLLDNIHLKIALPSIEERTQSEKEKFVHKFLLEEEKKLAKKILISNFAFNALVRFNYENNIDGIINAVKATCANANYSKGVDDEKIEIFLYHLPTEIMRMGMDEDISEDKHMLKLDDIKSNLLFDNIMIYYNDIVRKYHDYRSGAISEKEFISRAHSVLNKYCDYIIFEKSPYNQRTDTYKSIIDNIFSIVSNKYQIVIYSNCAFLLSRIIYKLTYVDDGIQEWEEKNKSCINDIMHIFITNFKDEYSIVCEISEMIFKTLDIELNSMNIIFMIMNIHFYNNDKKNQNKILGLVIAHGYSTASSIVDSVNKLLGQPVFSAIDMPLDVKVEDIVILVKKYIDKRAYYDDVILLVDMGSLEEIGSLLIDGRKVQIGVINNISTKVALDVGSKILSGMDMETILSIACKESVCTYRIFKNKKKDAIIFTTETGRVSTDRVMDVFKASIPKNVDIHLIPYDYNALLKGGKSEIIFEEYNVLLITGTFEISIDDIPYMAMEDIIAFKDIGKLNNIFLKYLSHQEIKEFNHNLLKNFSLENIMQSLTILNAKLLLGYIEKAVENLQRDLTITLSNKIRLRLYIHISSLVERLVTKEKMIEYPELEKFQMEHIQFIGSFKKSFREVCEHYNVEIPLTEIAYLYDYIFEDCI